MIDYTSLFIGAGLATAGFMLAFWIYYGFKSKEQIELEALYKFIMKHFMASYKTELLIKRSRVDASEYIVQKLDIYLEGYTDRDNTIFHKAHTNLLIWWIAQDAAEHVLCIEEAHAK